MEVISVSPDIVSVEEYELLFDNVFVNEAGEIVVISVDGAIKIIR